jgi:ArsR family transcriptional regulator
MTAQIIAEEVASMLHVLGNAHRLQICSMLLSEALCVNSLADRLGDHPNAVSQHLNLMKAMGMLTSRRIGKKVFYEIADDRIPCLLKCFTKQMPDSPASRSIL